jgi:adenine-specific DNA-methyltransferase
MRLLTEIDGLAAGRVASADSETRKDLGQFFTAPSIAAFMASMVKLPASRTVRVLDPGAGAGILGVALAERLLGDSEKSVHLVAVESDQDTRKLLSKALTGAKERFGSRFSFEIDTGDFLAWGDPGLFGGGQPPFDIAISNPPYFKMSPKEDRGGTAPNIYARFMEVAGNFLKPGGQMCFIVPRSFTSGLYFTSFRQRLRRDFALEQVHVFESRRDAFKDQEVLQENIIVLHTRGAQPTDVTITVSDGTDDLGRARRVVVPWGLLCNDDSAQVILRLPTSREDVSVLRAMDAWGETLHSYGLEISTGPVIPFRAEEYLLRGPAAHAGPLLWMQHVGRGSVTWPLGNRFRKPEYFDLRSPAKLLVANRTYVLLRRFSAKEDKHRLTAAALIKGSLPGEFIGLENHLNFIHRPGGELTESEAVALTALMNSDLLERYFRITNGNTQVNATDMRAMPLPPKALTRRLGQRLLSAKGDDPSDLVREVVGIENGRPSR